MIDYHAPFQTRIRQAVADANLQMALDRATARMSLHRVTAMGAVDGERLRDQVRQMKEWTLRHLPELLEQFESNVVANGGHVHWARDGAEACRIVSELAQQHGVRRIVKSKSMVTEEIHLNAALERAGMGIVETDLGEYIIQLAGEPPSHITAPVVHKRVEEIAELFQRELAMEPTLDPATICATARRVLRQEFLSAEMGISGGNFGIAETGTLGIVTNEGNGRMVSTMPPLYVAVMGIEKLVPTVEDAMLQYQALCRSATGQPCSVYLSLTSGPRRVGHSDGPEEFHVILLDNGRSRILAEGYGEALLCLRCGACLNVCPVYREIGGHAYASPYSGPIGAVITPLLADDPADARELPYASTLCGACRDACPVKIDLPRLLLDLRADGVAEGESPLAERAGMRAYAWAMGGTTRYEAARRAARAVAGVAARAPLPTPLQGWTESRDFPPFAARSFREQWAEQQGMEGEL